MNDNNAIDKALYKAFNPHSDSWNRLEDKERRMVRIISYYANRLEPAKSRLIMAVVNDLARRAKIPSEHSFLFLQIISGVMLGLLLMGELPVSEFPSMDVILDILKDEVSRFDVNDYYDNDPYMRSIRMILELSIILSINSKHNREVMI
jgi:hypothetical protein